LADTRPLIAPQERHENRIGSGGRRGMAPDREVPLSCNEAADHTMSHPAGSHPAGETASPPRRRGLIWAGLIFAAIVAMLAAAPPTRTEPLPWTGTADA
jgi:hypothetical protein